jgi:hypothetical protein
MIVTSCQLPVTGYARTDFRATNVIPAKAGIPSQEHLRGDSGIRRNDIRAATGNRQLI